jgi:hypothetical protein
VLTTRSGLAFGRRTLGWLWMLPKYAIQHINVFQENTLEFGDKIWRGRYNHYVNPFLLRKHIRQLGFEDVFFNSKSNLEQDCEATFWTNFSSDSILFYVFRKPL